MNLIVSLWPLFSARFKHVRVSSPFLVVAFKSAPFSSSNAAQSLCPLLHAISSGVYTTTTFLWTERKIQTRNLPVSNHSCTPTARHLHITRDSGRVSIYSLRVPFGKPITHSSLCLSPLLAAAHIKLPTLNLVFCSLPWPGNSIYTVSRDWNNLSIVFFVQLPTKH